MTRRAARSVASATSATATAAVLFSLLAAGCATPQRSDSGAWTSGRISVRVAADSAAAAQSYSGAFELRGDDRSGQLRLLSPLGTQLAEARWSPGQAVLATPQGEQRYDGVDELAQQALGVAVPLAALPSWLAGVPWPAAPHRPRDAGFEQLGWELRLARRAEGHVDAHRAAAPAVDVRVRLDPPAP